MFFNTLKYEIGLGNAQKFSSCCSVDQHHVNFKYQTVSALYYSYHIAYTNKMLAEFKRYECKTTLFLQLLLRFKLSENGGNFSGI